MTLDEEPEDVCEQGRAGGVELAGWWGAAGLGAELHGPAPGASPDSSRRMDTLQGAGGISTLAESTIFHGFRAWTHTDAKGDHQRGGEAQTQTPPRGGTDGAPDCRLSLKGRREGGEDGCTVVTVQLNPDPLLTSGEQRA